MVNVMPEEFMNTKEVARYLDIHEKQVYALIKAKKIPASRVTGKWVFPKKLIDEWIEKDAMAGIREAKERTYRIGGALLASGSNDPVLEMLHASMRNSYPDFYIFSANIGSMEGLKALSRGFTDIAWCHLFDPQSGEYNIPYVFKFLPNINAVVVNLFHRELGFITAHGNPLHITGFEDLVKKDVRIINRQKGSGTRFYLDYSLDKLGILTVEVSGYEKEVYTHLDVGLSILSGEADVGIATTTIAKLLNLTVIPITWESFDMVLDQPTFFNKGVQAFIDLLKSEAFRNVIEKLGGYDFRDAGKILYSAS